MSNQVKSLNAELKTVIYKHAEAENTVIKLRAQIGEQQKHINTLTNEKLALQARVKKLDAELTTEIAYHAGGDTHYRAERMRAALKQGNK